MTDAEHLHDIEQKLRCWGYLSHYPDAERDVAWLLERVTDQAECIAQLEARLQSSGVGVVLSVIPEVPQMKPSVEKPTLAEAKRALRWMRTIYLERATKPQRGQQRRFLEPDNSNDAAD